MSDRLLLRTRCTGETPHHVRTARDAGQPLIPCASSPDQAALEGALLSAIHRLSARSCEPVVRQVRVAPDRVRLQVAQHAIPGLLADLLPRTTPRNTVNGLPGLRPRPGRDRLDLHWLGPDGRPRAEVTLGGVTRERWTGMAAALVSRSADPSRLAWRAATTLHEAEIGLASTPVPDFDHVLSGLLRRALLWRESSIVDSALADDLFRLRWKGGASAADIAEVLQRSVAAIPGLVVVRAEVSGDTHALHLAQGWEDPGWAWVEIAHEVPPHELPAELWEQSEMRNALTACNISLVFRILRRQGVPHRTMARLTGCSQSEVSEILKGRRVMSDDLLIRIAHGLGVPHRYLRLHLPRQFRYVQEHWS
ncbi:hypothetical protein GCM10022247_37560 [Allokutzneria multivorans]|uniref:HTH cro/C1-type domain-containing protein n=1 Tax=Allokutzneria multivorans TaxID=1142134 RepID=A0ABP7SHG1_9PSEU